MRHLIKGVHSGSELMYAKAEAALAEAVEKFGADKAVGFPDTGYPCAIIWQYLEIKVATLADLQEAMKVLREKWLTKDLRVNSVFSSGLATAMAAEIIEVVKYIDNPKPYGDEYHGAMTDAEVRELGLPLVTEDIPGFVVMIGPAPSDEEARDMIKGYQSRGIFVFLIGGIIDQARRMGITLNFKVRVVDVGPDIWCVSHVVNLVMRAAMIFGNIQPGD